MAKKDAGENRLYDTLMAQNATVSTVYAVKLDYTVETLTVRNGGEIPGRIINGRQCWYGMTETGHVVVVNGEGNEAAFEEQIRAYEHAHRLAKQNSDRVRERYVNACDLTDNARRALRALKPVAKTC